MPGLVATGGYPLAHSDPPPPFARDIARSLAGAGFTRHGQIIDLVPAYRISVRTGQPLSERKLAGMFGKTSWRWARNRIAEARESPTLGW